MCQPPLQNSRQLHCVWVAVVSLSVLPISAEDRPAAAPGLGSQLVANALQLELEGDNEYRNLTLDTAIEHDGEFAPARWHRGQLRMKDQWLEVKAAMQQWSEDAELQEYERLRGTATESAADQVELARFCEQAGLKDRARLHWHRARMDPRAGQRELRAAAKALDLQQVAAAVLDGQQVQELLEHRSDLERNFEFWQDKLAKWSKALDSRQQAKRETALAELRAVRAPDAVLALELLLSPMSEAAALEVVGILDHIEGHEATQSLARHAMGAPWRRVAQQAASALKFRPKHEYVPMLLSALQSPIQTSFRVRNTGGIVQYDFMAFTEGIDANYLLAYSHQSSPLFGHHKVVDNSRVQTIVNPRTPIASTVSTETVGVVDNRITGVAMADLGAKLRMWRDQQRVAFANERIASENDRVFATLETATAEPYSREPTDWWEWWHEHNEVYGYDAPKPTYYDYRWSYQTYDAGVTTYERQSGTQAVYQYLLSCFPAGTPAWTETGIRPIETVLPGDRVLSQDPDSGELAFKVVINRTVRPPSEITGVTIAGETLYTTKGHPFWVNGIGWRMAKLLEPDQSVHTVGGSALVEQVAERPFEDEAFNLVVSDFGTYFVGECGVLVHDNTYRSPTRAVVPGLIPAQRDVKRDTVSR